MEREIGRLVLGLDIREHRSWMATGRGLIVTACTFGSAACSVLVSTGDLALPQDRHDAMHPADAAPSVDGGVTCFDGGLPCEGECRGEFVDREHCGACNVRCSEGAICAEGSCTTNERPTYRFNVRPGYPDELHDVALADQKDGGTFDLFAIGQLNDGRLGTDTWTADLGSGRAYEWVGWSQDVPAIELKFDRRRDFRTLRLGIVAGSSADIYSPQSIEVSFSEDGITYSSPSAFHENEGLPPMPDDKRTDVVLDVGKHAGRYARVRLVRSRYWVFVDEIAFP